MASAAKVIPFAEPSQVIGPIKIKVPWRSVRAAWRRNRIAHRSRFCRIHGGR